VEPVKVVVTGPFGAGKTTFIQTISEIATLSTEAQITDGTSFGSKNQTTVGIDYGRITLDEELVLYLFGTPGQDRFDFMWDVCSRGMLGFILLMDCTRPEMHKNALKIYRYFTNRAPTPSLICANKWTDPEMDFPLIRSALELSHNHPILKVNALDRTSIKDVLLAFLRQVLREIEREHRVVRASL